MALALETMNDAYTRDGFVFPLTVVDEAEAAAIRAELEAAETRFADDPDQLTLVRGYPCRLLPRFDALIRSPVILDAVRPILGDDLVVWSSALFIKEANTPHIVSWHQDLTYWGLDEADEMTAWVALSPATVESGCMRFVPGSHTQQIVPHVDTFAADNLLSRGQEITVEVDEDAGVDIVLRPGQASLHHGHLFHASGPNTTDDRRIGVAIRYMKTSMKQTSGDRVLATLVSGEDRYGHFNLVGSPEGLLHEADIQRCRRDHEIKRELLLQGVEAGKGRLHR